MASIAFPDTKSRISNKLRAFEVLIGAILIGVIPMFGQATNHYSGSVYTFESLSQIEGSGVVKEGDSYVLSGIVTIMENDTFKIDAGAVVEFANDAELVIKGFADLCAIGEPTTLRSQGDSNVCIGIQVACNQMTEVSNLHFEHVGLQGATPVGMRVRNCVFSNHNGVVSSALFLGGDGASFTVKNCVFEHCLKAAVGGAANYSCPVVIDSCTFIENSQANSNIPQLNLTSASEVTIRNCKVTGDSTLNMVGGIAIANWFGTSGHQATISNCDIRNNRYGITTMGVMDVTITDNQIVNNHYETNPNNGGSGISLYDPYLKQTAMVSGNHIEKSLWGVTVIGCGKVNFGNIDVPSDSPDYNLGGNVFMDNGNNGMPYDLYNNSANTVYAQGNYWSVDTQDEASIEEVIVHQVDNSALGLVIFMPAGGSAHMEAIKTKNAPCCNGIYRLDGTRMKTYNLDTLPKGVYIVNGKKIVF